MEVQFVLVGVLVTVAAGYLLRGAWRTWTGRPGCGGGCGCGKAANPENATGSGTFVPVQQLTLRGRGDMRSDQR